MDIKVADFCQHVLKPLGSYTRVFTVFFIFYLFLFFFSASQAYASQGPQTELHVVTERTGHSALNPVFQGTPTLDARNPKPTAGMQTNESYFC